MPQPTTPLTLVTYTLAILATSTFTLLNAWAAYAFSPALLARGYFLAFAFAMYSVAAVILVLGILVPPVMLGHWVYEVWSEEGPVEGGVGEVEVEGEA